MNHRGSLRAGFALALIAITACAPTQTAPQPPSGGAAPATAVPATAKPAVEQTAVIGYSNLSNTLDQHAQIGLNGRRYDIFDPLLLPNENGEPGPGIATAWKTVDPTTWQFTLRTDVKFSDGTPLTSEDVKYSYDRGADPARKLAIASRLSNIASTEAPDKATIIVKTKGPDPLLLRRLASIAIVPKAYTEKVGDEQFGLKPIGTGPYKVKEWTPSQLLVLTAVNDHPFRKPKLQQITIKNVPEASALIAGLQTGDLDYVNLVPLDQTDRLKSAGFAFTTVNAGASIGFFMDTVYNDAPVDGPTANKLVRQAINYAVDKDSIAKNIYHGFTKPEGQLAQEPTFGYNPDVKPYPYDPAKAKQLLAQAGYPNGFKTKMEVATVLAELQPMALLIQQNLKDVGIDMELSVLSDTAVWRDKFYNIQQRAPLFSIPLNNSPFMDADASINWFWSKNTTNRHYNNPEFDQLYEASRSEVDPAKRKELLQKAMAVMHDDPPFLFVVASTTVGAYNPKKITGFKSWVEADQRFDMLEKVG